MAQHDGNVSKLWRLCVLLHCWLAHLDNLVSLRLNKALLHWKQEARFEGLFFHYVNFICYFYSFYDFFLKLLFEARAFGNHVLRGF